MSAVEEPFLPTSGNKNKKFTPYHQENLNDEEDFKLALEELDENAKKNKYHRKTRKIYPFGKHPMRYVMGIIYSFHCLYLGMSINPLTPVAVTVASVSTILRVRSANFVSRPLI